ncbi:MAG: hypothetical protein J5607_11530 [Clostridiales bacterium]|nr:hypothetical protein [Clostridiales bacterium]
MSKYLRRGKEPRQQNPAYVGMRERISRNASVVGSSRVAPQERIVFLSQQKLRSWGGIFVFPAEKKDLPQ